MNTQLSTNPIVANGGLATIRAPGINVIVKSPTLESLTSRSFEESIESQIASQPQTPQQQQPPKPKRRFVFTDSKDSDDDVKVQQQQQRDKKIDRKFERLSSEIDEDDVDSKNIQFDEAYEADIKDDASELQNEFSKMSFGGGGGGGDSTSTGEYGSNTPDNDLQGD